MRKVVWSGLCLAACLAVTATVFAADGSQRPRQHAQQRLARQFEALDANHDGAIGREEWKGRPKVFERLDRNKDNRLSPQELRRGVRRMAVRRGVARRHGA